MKPIEARNEGGVGFLYRLEIDFDSASAAQSHIVGVDVTEGFELGPCTTSHH